MNADALNAPPKLARPGAGLPKPELWIARLMFGRFRKGNSFDDLNTLFRDERDAILRLARNCDSAAGSRQVLIKRLRGLEDSSRNWSVYMTLEHLRIVNAAVTSTILGLSNGIAPPGAASTAAVKPASGIGPGVLQTFAESCDDLLREAGAVGNGVTEANYRHPWFGPLDAAGWHAMAAFHMRLHRKQVESILEATGA